MAWSRICAGVIGRCSDIDGTCAEPVTAQVMMTLAWGLLIIWESLQMKRSGAGQGGDAMARRGGPDDLGAAGVCTGAERVPSGR
ncbi:hypothetical protein BGC_27930 [Burkholderia sp. 3C]